MKFATIIKSLVVLMVILSVFTRTVRRSKTLSKSKTSLDRMAEVKAYCGDGRANAPSGQWLYLDTNSIKSGNSGFIVKNYYKDQAFTCKWMNQISKQDSRNRYFASFRDFSVYRDAYGVENGWTSMRQFVFQMTGGVSYVFNIDKFLVRSSSISESELKSLVSTIDTNQGSYMTTFHNYRNNMRSLKVKAEELTDLKAKNLNTKEALQAEIANKKIQLAATQGVLKTLMDQAASSKLLIRNYEKQINQKKQEQLKPEMENLKVQVQGLEALDAQIKENNSKIQGIVPIDKNDLSESIADLRLKLSGLRALYLEADPKYTQFSTLIAHLDTQMDTIPSVIA